MKLALVASLIAGAAAFAPALQKASSTALKASSDYADALGAQAPVSRTYSSVQTTTTVSLLSFID